MQYLSQNQMPDIAQASAHPIQQAASGPAGTVEVPIKDMEINTSEHPEVVIPQELQHVVGKGSDAQELKIEKETLSTITTPTGLVHLPMTYEQALKKKKTTRFWDSMHWLASFIVYQWMKYDPDVVRAVKAKPKA